MKKTILILACLPLLALLCSCQSTEQAAPDTASEINVTFQNSVQDADVWILPQTEDNLKTTVWGTATAGNVKTGESRRIPAGEAGDDGLYLFRMIDSDGIFYSADGLTLQDGWTLQIAEDNLQSVTITVTNESDEPVGTYSVFAAKL